MSTAWHLDEAALASYASGDSPPVVGASVEAHLMECRACGAQLRDLMPPEPVDRAWLAIRAHVEEPRPGAVERCMAALGLSAESARLLGAVPSFRGAWMLGLFTVLVFVGAAASFAGDLGLSLFLIVAPLVPVAGVAASFGGDADPAHELIVATPYSAPRLLLLRTAGVLATSVPLTVLLGLALPGPAWLAVAWLTPAVAGVALTLALSQHVPPSISAAVIGAIWSFSVISADRLGGDPVAAVAPLMQVVLAGVAVSAITAIGLRHSSLDLLGRNS
jgi:hypothetical protein